MPLDSNIEIRVTGKNEASPAIQQATSDLDKLGAEYERLRQELSKEVATQGGMTARAKQLQDEMAVVQEAYARESIAAVTTATVQVNAAEVVAAATVEADTAMATADATYAETKAATTAVVIAEDTAVAASAVKTAAVSVGADFDSAAAAAAMAAEHGVAAATVVAEDAVVAASAEATAVSVSVSMAAITGGITIAATIIVGAATMIAGAFATIIALSADAIGTASSWADTVDTIHDVTGASAEASSALSYIATVAGSSPDAVKTAMAMNSRIIDDAAREMEDNAKETAALKVSYAEKETEATAALTEQRTEAERQHAERVADIQSGSGAAHSAFLERMAEREEDSLRQRERAQRSYFERVSDQAEAHVDRVASLQQSLADAEETIAQRAQDRADRLADRLTSFDETAGNRRLAIQQRVGMARDEFEKKALEGQLSDYDKATAEERRKIEEKAAQEEQRAKDADAKQIARIKARIDAENLEYDRQFRRQKQQFEEQEREKAEAYVRDTARMEKAQEKQGAAVGARLAAEEAAFSKMEAAREKAAAKAEEDRKKGFEKQLEAIKEKSPAVVKLIEDMGIKWDELIKMGPDEMFVRIATGIAGVNDAHEKINLLNKLYGRGGWSSMFEIIDMIGQKGFPALMQAAKDAGVVMDEQTTKKFEEAGRKARDLDMRMLGLKATVGVELLPIWEKLLQNLEKFWKEHGKEVMSIFTRLVDDVMPPMLIMFDKWLEIINKIADSKFWATIGGAAKLLATIYGGAVNASTSFIDLLNGTQTPSQSPGVGATTFNPNHPEAYISPGLTYTGNAGPRPAGWVGTWPPGSGQTAPVTSGEHGPTINITNNYPSPPVTSDEALGYWLLTLGLGGRK